MIAKVASIADSAASVVGGGGRTACATIHEDRGRVRGEEREKARDVARRRPLAKVEAVLDLFLTAAAEHAQAPKQKAIPIAALTHVSMPNKHDVDIMVHASLDSIMHLLHERLQSNRGPPPDGR